MKTASGSIVLANKRYQWVTDDDASPYQGLGPAGASHILRIVESDGGFDIVMGYRHHEDRKGRSLLVIGPIVVLGSAFPTAAAPVLKGARIRLRPKISIVREGIINDMAVRRTIEWSLSTHFRAVRCNLFGLPQKLPQDDYSEGAPKFGVYSVD